MRDLLQLGVLQVVMPSHQFKTQLATDNLRSAHQRLKRGTTVFRIKQAVNLRAAGLHHLGHAHLGNALLFHFGSQLPGNHFLDCRRRNRFTNTLFVEPICGFCLVIG